MEAGISVSLSQILSRKDKFSFTINLLHAQWAQLQKFNLLVFTKIIINTDSVVFWTKWIELWWKKQIVKPKITLNFHLSKTWTKKNYSNLLFCSQGRGGGCRTIGSAFYSYCVFTNFFQFFFGDSHGAVLCISFFGSSWDVYGALTLFSTHFAQ